MRYPYYAIKKAVKHEARRNYRNPKSELKIKLGIKRGCAECGRIITINAKVCQWCSRNYTEEEINDARLDMEEKQRLLQDGDKEMVKSKEKLDWYNRISKSGFLSGLLGIK